MITTTSPIVDQYGKPITKSLDPRSFLGFDRDTIDSWHKQPKPDRKRLLKEVKGLVYACIDLRAATLSKIDIACYSQNNNTKRYGSKRLDDNEIKKLVKNPYQRFRLKSENALNELTDHQSIQLLYRPSPTSGYVDIMWQTSLMLDATCIAYWYLPANKLGTPGEIHVLRSDLTKEVKDRDGNVTAYEYGHGADKITYDPEEIIVFRYPNPDGVSPLMSIYENLNIENKLAATTAALLDNNARPDVIVSFKEGIGADEAAKYEHRFNQKYKKAGSGGAIAIEEDVSVTPLTFSPRSMAWLEINDTTRLKICNAFKVPYALLDKASASQYGVLQTLRLALVEDATIPILRLIQDTLNREYISRWDDSGALFLCFDDATPKDREQNREDVKAGVITPNDARTERGLAPLPEGDKLNLPVGAGAIPEAFGTETSTTTEETTQEVPVAPQNVLNGAQIASAMAIVQSVVSGQLPRDAALGALQTLLNLSLDQANAIMGSVGLTFAPVTAETQQAAPATPATPIKSCSCGCKSKILGHKKKLPKGTELAKVLQKFFAKQKEEILKNLPESKSVKANLPKKFVHLAEWDRDLFRASQPIIELYFLDAYKAKAKEYVARTGISPDIFNVTNPHLAEKVKGLALSFCKETNATTTQNLNDALVKLRGELEEGLVAGDRMSDLVDKVQSVFENASDERAFLVSQSESSRSHHEAQLQAAKDSGVVSGTKILLSSDACELCQSIAAEGEVELGGSFFIDEKAPDAYQVKEAPPLHPGCQCALEEVLIETQGQSEGE